MEQEHLEWLITGSGQYRHIEYMKLRVIMQIFPILEYKIVIFSGNVQVCECVSLNVHKQVSLLHH